MEQYLRDRVSHFCSKKYQNNREFIELPVQTALSQLGSVLGKAKNETIDKVLSETCANLIEFNFEYTYVAARILLLEVYSTTEPTFSRCVARINIMNSGLLAEDYVHYVENNAKELDAMINEEYDEQYTYQAAVKMHRQYLLRKKSAHETIIFERPQYMYLRIATALFMGKEAALSKIEKYYNCFASQLISAASPMIFHAGTIVGQLSSCFLVGGPSDSLRSILDTNTRFGLMMKGAGGLGCNVSRIRSAGRPINSSGGTSNGVVPLLKLFDATGRYVDQGGNRRPGVVNVSIEPWHPEFEEIIGLRAPGRQDDKRLFNVHLTAYMCDLFMQRAEQDYQALRDGTERVLWSFFSPDTVPKLVTTWGNEFNTIYQEAEAAGLFLSQVPAANLMQSIVYYQHWTGEPCVVFKDSVNRHSNQLHMGTLTNLNLCVEIALYCDEQYTAVCNLASICLSRFIRKQNDLGEPTSTRYLFDADHPACPFDWRKFYSSIQMAVKFLNQVIDRTRYPLEEAKNASQELRPIGIGIQGLADVLIFLREPFGSETAKRFDTTIYASLYFFATHKSSALAKKHGAYQRWKESPWFRQKKLHCDGYIRQSEDLTKLPGVALNFIGRLRERVMRYGLRNSQLIAQMPTASTAHLTGNIESFEPLENVIFVMREISGNFICINERVSDLLAAEGLITPENIARIKESSGSVQDLVDASPEVKRILRTAYEIPQRELLEHAIARTPYIDQSMSLNVFFGHDASSKLPSYLFHAWKNGLKTATYYVRSRQRGGSIKFTLNPQACESCTA